MAKRASLEPKHTKKPHAPWVVNLPPGLSSNGKRERRYFDSKKAAAEFCRQQRIRLENYGTASTYLPAGKVEEALAAIEKLEGTGISLIQAAEEAVQSRKERASSVTFKTMFDQFIEAKRAKQRSAPYLTALRCTLPRFTSLHDRLVSEMSAHEIDVELAGTTPSVYNAFLRYLRAAFNFGIRQGWCERNPIERIEMHSLRMRREILTNAQVAALLRIVQQSAFDLMPYHILCFFAGIRPREVERLDWSNIHLGRDKFIEVPEEKSKTGRRRIIYMEPVLVRWLKYFIKAGGAAKGPVTPLPNLRHRLRAVRKAAKIERWPQDAPRRTYASCWLAMHSDVNRLNNMMGHTSPDMLWKHYHNAVTRKQARGFWEIAPPSLKAKTIAFAV